MEELNKINIPFDMKNSIINFIVEAGTESKRIESLLRDIFPDVSRAKWREDINEGRVRVNDRIAKVGLTLKAGDRVCIEKQEEAFPGMRFEGEIEEYIVPIVYEDEFLFVFDKPKAMHSVLQDPDDPPTLSDYAVIHCKESLNASQKLQDGGLVQRLDYFTSGLCVVAKSRDVWEDIHEQLISHSVNKTYQAYVPSGISQSVLKSAIANGLFIEGEIINSTNNFSIVQVTLRDGSRHVVRRMFKDIGYPLLGDIQYGGTTYGEEEGFFLRCVKIELKHPVTEEKFIVETTGLMLKVTAN